MRRDHEMKAARLVALAFVIFSIMACLGIGEDRRDAFVSEFMRSAQVDTEFHKKFLDLDELELIKRNRPWIAGDYHIDRWDSSGMGAYEYYLIHESGTEVVLYLDEDDGSVVSVGISIYPGADKK